MLGKSGETRSLRRRQGPLAHFTRIFFLRHLHQQKILLYKNSDTMNSKIPNLTNSFLIFVGLMIFSWAGPLNAQEVGDTVVVTANFETKIYEKKVDQVQGGDIHTVEEIEGTWCQLSDVKGWLPLENVMNLKMAFKHFDGRVEDDIRDADAWATCGMIQYEWKEYEKAAQALNQSLRYNSRNSRAWNNLGKIFIAQNKYQGALEAISNAIKLHPKFEHAYANRGLIFYAQGRYDDAIADFSKAIELDAKNPWFYINRAGAKSGKGELDSALEDYNLATELNKRIAEAYIGRSNIFLAKDDLEAALKETNDAVRLDRRNAIALNARGWVKYKRGELEDAIADCKRAIRYAPGMFAAFSNRAICYVRLERYTEAISDYDKALELAPKSPTTLLNRAVAWYGMGEYTRAKTDFEEAIELAPTLHEAQNAYAWFLCTCESDKFRNGEKALKIAKDALELSGEQDWYVVDTLAAAYAEQGRFADARRWQLRAKELAPEADKPKCQERFEMYENKKPYRSSVGKSSEGKEPTPVAKLPTQPKEPTRAKSPTPAKEPTPAASE